MTVVCAVCFVVRSRAPRSLGSDGLKRLNDKLSNFCTAVRVLAFAERLR